MASLRELLSGGDLRTIGKAGAVIFKIRTQADFDTVFKLMFDKDRLVVMRAADVIEKVSRENPHYLNLHKKNILKLLLNAKHIEFKWHLAQLIPRLNLNSEEFTDSWQLLVSWLKDKTNSRIVRVSSLQSLFEMANQNKNAVKNFKLLFCLILKKKIFLR